METSVEKWLDGRKGEVAVASPVSLHLDELDGWAAAVDKVAFAFTSFRSLWEASESAGLNHKVLLVWPLGCSEQLDTTVPAELVTVDEPPSLYIVHRDADHLPDVDEEYRRPLDPKKFGASFDEGHAYYRCFRTPDGVANDWEFERCVYFVHDPKG